MNTYMSASTYTCKFIAYIYFFTLNVCSYISRHGTFVDLIIGEK